ncbi:ribonuclease D [Leptospira kobayashii]|uniref:Ribonuclease D n=1 Tax=Leptospira kobayashii TaxID=1917830 RepID=A0ABN6KCH4_9LEPT|nr:ribonuclease D [Leptospira kobayashii]BDA77208.1 ribonuclease D [Leptospira kobayashii]
MQINSNYILVDTAKALELALINLKQSKILSIDTESSGYYTYFPKVCLIQINSNGKNYLIDPLKITNLKGLAPLFADPNILKIFHSAQDDIKALKRDFGFQFTNVADTMISSRLLSMEQSSLAFVVEHYHKVSLSKVEQKSNWEIRPLQTQQLRYAALDTAYLETIWLKMEEELKRRNLYEEAKSEFEFTASEDYVEKGGEGFHIAKFPDIINFTPLERRKILELLRYRDEKAKKINKAPFRVFNNDRLSQAVKEQPNEEKCMEWFGKKDGSEIYKLLISEYSDPIETSELSKRHGEDLNEEEDKKFQNAKKWRLRVMRIRRMEHSLLPSNKQLIAILRANPQNIEELKALHVFSDWKVENYGPSLLTALGGVHNDSMLSKLVSVRSKEAFLAKKRKKQNHSQKEE